jgi:hypothetical protein
MTKYVEQISTGRIYVSTPRIARMPDMRALQDNEAEIRLYGRSRAVEAKAAKMEAVKAAEPLKKAPETNGEPKDQVEAVTFAQRVEAATTKDEIEALALEAFGVDVDKRKSLDTLKAEVLAL